MNTLKRRILDISYKLKLSHLGSCLTAVDIIDEIFKIKKPDEKFVLSSGHAALALYCVLEKYGGRNAEEIFNHHGVHPDRCEECHIDCSTGSLGQGLPIAVGMALADRSKNVYCLISDGECAEGSIWEALRIATEQKLANLKVFCNSNQWGAYDRIDWTKLFERLTSFRQGVYIIKPAEIEKILKQEEGHGRFAGFVIILIRTKFDELLPVLREPQEAHYKVLSKEEYESI